MGHIHIDASMPVSEKVERLQNCLGKDYFHASGIMYSGSHLDGDTFRPFTANDRKADQSYPHTSAGFTPEGHNNSENSAMVCGLFLQSQSLRFRATGDAEALEFAAKAFRSVDTIYTLSERAGRDGFICKPYDWKASLETSIDQYTCAMMGLWEYHTLAPLETRQRIAHMLAKMADWWRLQAGYKITYFERDYDLLPYHAPRLACLNAMAYRVTGDHTYAAECTRLLGMAGAWATTYDAQRLAILKSDPATLRRDDDFFDYDPKRGRFLFRTREVSAEIYLGLACADWFMRNDAYCMPLLKHVIARYTRQMQFGLRDDLLALYGFELDLQTETWRALHTTPTAEQRANALAGFLITSYFSEVCWGDFASRIPDACIIAHQHAPEFSPGALDLARRMLQKLDQQRLHWMIDPDGNQLLPELAWMREVMGSDPPVFTILTYWRAKAQLSTGDFAQLVAPANG